MGVILAIIILPLLFVWLINWLFSGGDGGDFDGGDGWGGFDL